MLVSFPYIRHFHKCVDTLGLFEGDSDPSSISTFFLLFKIFAELLQ